MTLELRIGCQHTCQHRLPTFQCIIENGTLFGDVVVHELVVGKAIAIGRYDVDNGYALVLADQGGAPRAGGRLQALGNSWKARGQEQAGDDPAQPVRPVSRSSN
ncbi:hypothetical protein D3C81_1254430 [compost metagenome]